MLRFIRPQLATSVDQPPEGENWIHEIKNDGYRCQVPQFIQNLNRGSRLGGAIYSCVKRTPFFHELFQGSLPAPPKSRHGQSESVDMRWTHDGPHQQLQRLSADDGAVATSAVAKLSEALRTGFDLTA